jgi:tRNA threonylcarbamoyladenosine biosynthesis protein TsaB
LNILAIDTATNILSVALETDTGIMSFEADSGPHHSALLMDTVDTLVKRAGLAPADLDGVTCMRGPGSFTGLRVGFAAARGMALSLNIPMASVSTLDCMAFSLSFWPGIVLPLIDAKKNRFFTALYRGGSRISGDMDADALSIAESVSAANAGLSDENSAKKAVILTGPDAEMFYNETEKNPLPRCLAFQDIKVDPGYRRGRANELLAIAKVMNLLNNGGDAENSGPVYVRKSDAELQFLETVGKNG